MSKPYRLCHNKGDDTRLVCFCESLEQAKEVAQLFANYYAKGREVSGDTYRNLEGRMVTVLSFDEGTESITVENLDS